MTTKNRCRRRPPCGPGFLRWGTLLVAGVLLLGACSTARQRYEPVGPMSLLRFRDPQTHAYFDHVYRTGNLYLDFRPALIVDAIVEDRTYRDLYVKMLQERYFLTDQQAAQARAQQEQAFATHVDVLLFTYEGTNPPTQLTKSDALWRLYLRDDDGQLVLPDAIEKIPKDSTTFAYLDKYFFGLDRWTSAYRVRFPKLSKALLGQPVGHHPFELIVTGVKGTVTLRWENPRIFYGDKGPTG